MTAIDLSWLAIAFRREGWGFAETFFWAAKILVITLLVGAAWKPRDALSRATWANSYLGFFAKDGI